jgi:hypothetical protein
MNQFSMQRRGSEKGQPFEDSIICLHKFASEIYSLWIIVFRSLEEAS